MAVKTFYCIILIPRQTFDLIDSDSSGSLDKAELENWFAMCGAELDLSSLLEVLLCPNASFSLIIILLGSVQ